MATDTWNSTYVDVNFNHDNWTTAADWSLGTVPGSSDDVVLPAGSASLHYDPRLTSNQTVGTLNSVDVGDYDSLIFHASSSGGITLATITNGLTIDAGNVGGTTDGGLVYENYDGTGGGTISVGGALTVGGGVDPGQLVVGSGLNYSQLYNDTVSAASLDNEGRIDLLGSSAAQSYLTVSGTTLNNGRINLANDHNGTGGAQYFANQVTGSGTISLDDSTIKLHNGVGASQTVSYVADGVKTNTLILDNSSNMVGTISGWAAHDKVRLNDFTGAGASESYNSGTHVLTITQSGHTTANLTFATDVGLSSFSFGSVAGTGELLISHS